MFRLEENRRAGADMGLALALLHAWIATGTEDETAVISRLACEAIANLRSD